MYILLSIYLFTLILLCVLLFYCLSLGTGDNSQGLNPQSCPARPQVADRGYPFHWVCQVEFSLAADHSGSYLEKATLQGYWKHILKMCIRESLMHRYRRHNFNFVLNFPFCLHISQNSMSGPVTSLNKFLHCWTCSLPDYEWNTSYCLIQRKFTHFYFRESFLLLYLPLLNSISHFPNKRLPFNLFRSNIQWHISCFVLFFVKYLSRYHPSRKLDAMYIYLSIRCFKKLELI